MSTVMPETAELPKIDKIGTKQPYVKKDKRYWTKGKHKRRGPYAHYTKHDNSYWNARWTEAREARGGNTEKSLVDASADLAESQISKDFFVYVSPDETGLDLLDRLQTVTEYAIKIHAMIAGSVNVRNAEIVGHYQKQIDKLLDISAMIKGGRMSGGNYGSLSEDEVDRMKEQLARSLSATLTKLAHTTHIAETSGIFLRTGEVKAYANKGIINLIGGAAHAILRRAKLDQWSARKHKRGGDAMLDAYLEM